MKNIIHPFLRFWLRLTSYFFFEKICISGIENLPVNNPVIFACNHPNAFLDSIVMTTCIKRPLHYIARGDFFNSKIASALLHFINILPVYRREEGKQLLHKNNETFSYCMELFRKNGALVIFSEGLSENKWELRPLRKGTARLAFEAWNNPEIADRLKVVPVAIHYSSWMKAKPVVTVEFLKNIERDSFDKWSESGIFNREFNEKLKERLSEKCIMVDKKIDSVSQIKIVEFMLKNFINGAADAKKIQDEYLKTDNQKFKSEYKSLADFLIKKKINYSITSPKSSIKLINQIGWFMVFITAFIYNFIPYYACKFIIRRVTKGNDFYDSLLYCMLMLIYPFYLIILFLFSNHFMNYQSGLINVFLAASSAFYYETSKRYIHSFRSRKELATVHDLFNRLFEKGNG